MDPEEIRRLADDIVARREFQEPEPSVIERVRDWIADLVTEVLEAAFSGEAGSIIGWVVLAAVAVAIVWFLTRLGRSVQRDPHPGIRVEEIHRRTPAEWRAEAEEHEAAGEWKLALRCRYRALVGDLIAEGALADIPGRTTGEFRVEMAERAPARADDFAAATEIFELAWYADRRTGPEQNQRFQDLAARIAGVRA